MKQDRSDHRARSRRGGSLLETLLLLVLAATALVGVFQWNPFANRPGNPQHAFGRTR